MMARMTRRTRPVPRLQPISFFSIGSSGSACVLRNSSPTLICDMVCAPLAGQRRFHAAEEQPGNQQPDPDDESEQAHEVNRGETPDALLPEFLEIRGHPDRKEGTDEE